VADISRLESVFDFGRCVSFASHHHHLAKPLRAKMRPPSQVLRAIAEAQSKVFSTTPPPPIGQESLRTGAKYLRKGLVGPSMLKYYPPILNLRSFAPMFPELATYNEETGKMKTVLQDSKEVQRLLDVERRKAMGKGPPKKGECRQYKVRGSITLMPHVSIRRGKESNDAGKGQI
jgi:small subunit ribosomal protein S33